MNNMRKESIANLPEKFLCFLEDLWVKGALYICALLGIMFGLFYYCGLIGDIEFVILSVVSYASIIIGVTGVFLTLLITLKESVVFKRLERLFPNINIKIYLYLRNLIYYGLLVIVISVLISIAPDIPNKIIASMVIGIWFFFFWLMTIGTFYGIKLITDLIVRNIDFKERKQIE